MRKPTKKSKEKCYDYHEMVDYIEAKYKCDIRDYAGKFSKNAAKDTPYLDFWHWFIGDNGSIHNGCYSYINTRYYDVWDDRMKSWVTHVPDDKKWVCEILTMFRKEFGGPRGADEIKVWIEW